MLEAETEAEANLSGPRPKFWPRGLNITGNNISFSHTKSMSIEYCGNKKILFYMIF